MNHHELRLGSPVLALFKSVFVCLLSCLHPFNLINQQDAATSQVYCLSFKYGSTCFRHPHAHHQDLQQLK